MGIFSDKEFEITKRELGVSIIVIALLWTLGIYIAGLIEQHIFDTNEKYDKAIQITESEKFNYALNTDFGHVFAYGDLNAVGVAGDSSVNGYMAVIRKLQKEVKHYRDSTYKCGSKTCSKRVSYWTWETKSTALFHVDSVEFMGSKINYRIFPTPKEDFLEYKKIDRRTRYAYYVQKLQYKGTLFAEVHKDTLLDASFHPDKDIESAYKELRISEKSKNAFWAIFVAVLVFLTYRFYKADNLWLYPARKKEIREKIKEQRRLLLMSKEQRRQLMTSKKNNTSTAPDSKTSVGS